MHALLQCNSGKKKSPIMLLAWQVVLGAGTTKSVFAPASVQDEHMRLNMLGHCDTGTFLDSK